VRIKNVLACVFLFLIVALSVTRFFSSGWVSFEVPAELWLVGFYVAVPAAAALVLAALFKEEV